MFFILLFSESKFYYGLRIANGTLGGSGTNDTGVYALLGGTSGATTNLYNLGYFQCLNALGYFQCNAWACNFLATTESETMSPSALPQQLVIYQWL